MNAKLVCLPGGPVPLDEEREALARLDRVRGAGGMRVALLSLLLARELPGRVRTWREETTLVAEAESIREDVERLGPTLRMPLFELLLARLGGTPLADRQQLLRSARRVMSAPGHPIDRLLWLAMRRHFGEQAQTRVLAPADAEISQFAASDRSYVAQFTAHLARMVPNGHPAEGQRWYAMVLSRWMRPDEIPPWQRPDVDVLVHALSGLQALSWRQRPQLARAWVGTALPAGRPITLTPVAADALRLSCLLLDTPIPPELARLYVEVNPD